MKQVIRMFLGGGYPKIQGTYHPDFAAIAKQTGVAPVKVEEIYNKLNGG